MILNLAFVVILLVVAVAVARGGLFQAMGLFFAVLLAASLASAWYEPLVAYLEKPLEPYRYFLDVGVLWFLFGVILVLLGAVVQQLTKRKVSFHKHVELVGGILVGLMAAWTVVEFAAFSLHTAPLRADVIPTKQGTSMLFGLKPDRCWLWWMRGSSRNGPFAITGQPFDPDADFVERYARRREQLSGGPPAGNPPAN
ncbi:MAG: CvpA family protein [Planctomycetia bacterium]